MLAISPDVAVQLPIDELAMLVLRDLATSHEVNEYNYGNSLRQDMARGYAGSPDARKAVSEAMAWLHSRGLIARKIEEHSSHTIFVTRWGHRALSRSLAAIRSVERVQENLHPLIEQRVRRQFLLGEYEQAIFVAMKSVEVRVRKLAGYGDEMIGTDLMTKAFKTGGPLADPDAPSGEVDGTIMLFRGAYAVLRNPSGHREVTFDDVTEASEAVMTASLLMRMLDRIEQRILIILFKDDDAGFLAWVTNNPDGYFVNAERNPKPSYLVLHKCGCSHFTGNPGRSWTKDYIKFCSRDSSALVQWAARSVGGQATRCPTCLD